MIPRFSIARAGLALLSLAVVARGDVTLVGTARVPGDAVDKSGLHGRYTNADGQSIPADQFGSFGSALDYTGAGNRYIAVNDRGFGDGSSASVDRFHLVDILADPAKHTLDFQLVSTALLTDEAGRPLVGQASAFSSDPARNLRFDPEGLRLARDGSFFISDEYGPTLAHFAHDGRRLRILPIPPKFQVSQPDADGDAETKRSHVGRVSNRGMEGLAITPDGRALVGAMQSALIQDGGRKSRFVRLLVVDLAHDAHSTREYVYPLESPAAGVNEILAVDADLFLVLERDNKAGTAAKLKALFLIDLKGATDVSARGTTAENGLPATALPDGVRPVAKRRFLNLLDPKFGLAGADFPAKMEGAAWGPNLADGRRLLILTSDNDLKRDQPSVIFAFAVDKSDLAR